MKAIISYISITVTVFLAAVVLIAVYGLFAFEVVPFTTSVLRNHPGLKTMLASALVVSLVLAALIQWITADLSTEPETKVMKLQRRTTFNTVGTDEDDLA